MATGPYNSYTLKKNETLAQIAKSHRLQIDEIWDFKLNAKLKSKRHTADKCVAGDVVQLPLSKAEKQEALARVDGVLKALKNRSADLNTALKKLDSIQAEVDSSYKTWGAQIDKIQDRVNTDGGMADAGAIVISFSISMGMMAKSAMANGAKTLVGSSAEIGAQVSKMDRAVMVSTLENLYGPLSPMGSGVTSLMALSKDSTSVFMDAVGTAADFFGKLTSPSGWAKYFTSVDKDLAKAREQIQDNFMEMRRQIRARRTSLEADLKSVDKTQDVLDRAYQNMKKG